MVAIHQLRAEQAGSDADGQVGRGHLVLATAVIDVPEHTEEVT